MPSAIAENLDASLKEKIEELRKRIPAGIQHAMRLLEKSDGNVSRAESLFREEMVLIVVEKAETDATNALKYLELSGFDIAKTLQLFEEERYSLAERILRNTKDKERALSLLTQMVGDKMDLPRDYWLKLDRLGPMEPVVFCLLSVIEWIGYESWESFDAAIYFHTELVAQQIEEQLALPEIAAIIRKGKMLADKENVIRTSGFSSKLLPLHDRFKHLRPQLIDALYQLVSKNIGRFE